MQSNEGPDGTPKPAEPPAPATMPPSQVVAPGGQAPVPDAPPPMPLPEQPGAPSNTDPARYEFIMNPPKAKKSLLGGGESMKQRIIVVAAGGLVLVILAIIVSTIIGNASKPNTQRLVDLTAEQTEIIRIADNGTKQGRSLDTRAFAATTKYSLTTAQQTLLAYLKKNGHKVSAKVLASKKNATTDQSLTAAQLTNRYDTVFVAELQKELTTYRQDLKTAYDGAKGKNEKAALQYAYDQTTTLLKQKISAPDDATSVPATVPSP